MSIISINARAEQREKDARKLALVRENIEEHQRSLDNLYAMERELVNRLDLNKPDGSAA